MTLNELRENLIDRMIAIYGFEHPAVVEFCRICEYPQFTDQLLETIVKAHEECPYLDNEDDE